MDYIQKLKSIGLELLQPLGYAKALHMVRCSTCQHTWKANLASKIQSHKKYGGNGCPVCRKNTRYQEIQNNKQKILTRKFDILSPYIGEVATSTITVRNKQCGHIFDSAPGNLLHRNVSCPICNKAEKIKRLNTNSIARSAE